MKSTLLIAMTIIWIAFAPAAWLQAADPAHSEHHPASEAGPVHQGRGVVEAVDPAKGVVTVEHEPIVSLRWPKMVMDFKARDPEQLKDLKEGDQVEFDLLVTDKDNYSITRIRRLP